MTPLAIRQMFGYLQTPTLPMMFLFPALVFAQQKSSPRPFVPPPAPKSGYVIGSILLFADLGCAKDFVSARGMEGLERRKKVKELIEYGCAKTLDDAIYSVIATQRVDLTQGKGSLLKCIIFVDVEITKLARGGREFEYDGNLFKEGWILGDDFRAITTEEITELIRKSLAKKTGTP